MQGLTQVDEATRSEVLQTLEQWLTAYGHSDLEALLSLYVQDDHEGVVMLGTDRGERHVGISAVRRVLEKDLRAFRDASIGIRWAIINGIKPEATNLPQVVWVAAEVSGSVTVTLRPIPLAARWSIVLVREGDRWLISQSHFSSPRSEAEADNPASYTGLVGRFT